MRRSYLDDRAALKLSRIECNRCGVEHGVHHAAGSWGDPCGPTHTHFVFPPEHGRLQRSGTGLERADQRQGDRAPAN